MAPVRSPVPDPGRGEGIIGEFIANCNGERIIGRLGYRTSDEARDTFVKQAA